MVSVIACDDGVVRKLGQGYTIVACVLWHDRPLDVELNPVKVDGFEASTTIAYAMTKLKLRSRVEPEALLLDSITIAGFNIASPPTIAKLTETPVIVVYKYKPSSERLERALRNLKDYQLKMRVLRIVDNTVEITTRKGVLHIITWGMELEKARHVIEETQIHSRVPEPIRIAHMVASEATKLILSN